MSSTGPSVPSDEHFLRQALVLAEQAYAEQEVPIGAVVVCKGRVIGRGYNQVEKLNDATAHAEMLAITAACSYLGSKYLEGCTLYVTIEPCPMCAGAMRWVQLSRVVYGAGESKFGYSRFGPEMLHPRTEVAHGVHEEDCRALMRSFFQQKRGQHTG
jgi:tRNA(adenine34) deaminase